MLSIRRSATAGLMVGVVLVAAAAPLQSANARDGRNAAIFGGLAAGAIAGGIIANGSQGYGAAPYYRNSAVDYGYDSDDGVVVRQCYRERRPVYDDWGDLVGFRRVRVCD